MRFMMDFTYVCIRCVAKNNIKALNSKVMYSKFHSRNATLDPSLHLASLLPNNTFASIKVSKRM